LLRALGDRYGASRPAVLRRLLTFGLTTHDFYRTRITAWQEEYRSRPKPARPPIIKWSRRVVNANGPRYTRLVLNGYRQEAITLSAVADYLGTKLNHLDAIEQIVLGPRRRT
jgi:hypothetical protein